MFVPWICLCLAAFCSCGAEVTNKALSEDDECLPGSETGGCSINALQLSGVKLDERTSGDDEVPPKELLEELELGAEEGRRRRRRNSACLTDCKLHSSKSSSVPCSERPQDSDCYLWRKCRSSGHNLAYCQSHGYMIVPKRTITGIDAITPSNAASFDHLWFEAQDRCGSNTCRLAINSKKFRSQSQMHIHYARIRSHGQKLKAILEKVLCGSHGWKAFRGCGRGKARLYDEMPGIFTAVSQAYGGGYLGNIGISVFFTNKCGGGQKAMVLAQDGCRSSSA